MQKINEIKNNVINSIKPETLMLTNFDIIKWPGSVDFYSIKLIIANFDLTLTESDLHAYFSLHNNLLVNDLNNIYLRFQIDEIIYNEYEFIIKLILWPANHQEYEFGQVLWNMNQDNDHGARLRNKRINHDLYKLLCKIFEFKLIETW
jgi:hypothetical protein